MSSTSELMDLLYRKFAPGHKFENFHDYVARQMRFKDGNECPKLSKLAYEYLKGNEGIDGKIYDYFANEGEEYAESLYVKLVEEFERCIFSCFSVGWNYIPLIISQILNVASEPKVLSNFVMTTTRKQWLENITKDLKVRRMLSTTPVRGVPNGEHGVAEVMFPIPHSERNPVLLVVAGGIGAGKSTVLKHILNESFWMGAAANAVMVDDVERENQSSKELLVRALNEGRDVIMNSTLSWGIFALQTVGMARNIHERRYRAVENDGNSSENYWEQIEEDEKGGDSKIRKPYRIELVGVVCDPYLAVVRRIRRAIQIGEVLNVKSPLNSPVNVYLLLKSHKKFATLFRYYSHLVDVARLYNTNVIGQQPKLIAWRSEGSKVLFDPKEIEPLKLISNLKAKADSIYELYGESNQAGYIWSDIALAPERVSIRSELHTIINKIEKSAI